MVSSRAHLLLDLWLGSARARELHAVRQGSGGCEGSRPTTCASSRLATEVREARKVGRRTSCSSTSIGTTILERCGVGGIRRNRSSREHARECHHSLVHGPQRPRYTLSPSMRPARRMDLSTWSHRMPPCPRRRVGSHNPAQSNNLTRVVLANSFDSPRLRPLGVLATCSV